MEIKVDGVRLEITWIICIFTMKTIQDSPARNCVFLVSCVMTHSLENILSSKNWYYMTICITYSARIQAGIHFYHWKTCRESSKYHFLKKDHVLIKQLYYTIHICTSQVWILWFDAFWFIGKLLQPLHRKSVNRWFLHRGTEEPNDPHRLDGSGNADDTKRLQTGDTRQGS